MQPVADNYRSIVRRIEAACERVGRDPTGVTVVGAAKTVDAKRVEEALDAGLQHIGENYVQEALGKHELLGSRACWHCIGHLQTNKVKQAVRLFDWIHSLDRVELAGEISRRAGQVDCSLRCLVEVNVGYEQSKSGVAPEDLPGLLRAVAGLPNLQIVGLMAIPPERETEQESRADFRQMKELARSIRQLEIPGVAMDHLSMGMTHDFEVAIEEGATIVRIGTGIFGPRP